MIEVISLKWKVPRHGEVFPCFTRGCLGEASYVVKIRRGEVTIQLCLCRECLGKSHDAIIQGVNMRTGNVFN